MAILPTNGDNTMATKKTATKTIKSAAKATKARATEAAEQAKPTMSALFARAKSVASSIPGARPGSQLGRRRRPDPGLRRHVQDPQLALIHRAAAFGQRRFFFSRHVPCSTG